MLSYPDQCLYHQLQQVIKPLSYRARQVPATCRFKVVLSHIQQFAIRQETDDWKRCLVCGIVWLDGAIAISPRQLSTVTGKCKSAINAGFHALGYTNIPITTKHAIALMPFFQQFSRDCHEMRQWSVREVPRSNSPLPETVPGREPEGLGIAGTLTDHGSAAGFDTEDFGFEDDYDCLWDCMVDLGEIRG
jgi:hypothetical protein